MAKEKLSGLEKLNKTFGEVMQRASLSFYFSNNNHLINKSDHVTVITMTPSLWELLHSSGWMKDHSVREIRMDHPEERSLITYDSVCNDDGWVNISNPESLYQGNVNHVDIPEIDYSVSYTKDLFPLKLKKAEYTDISTKLTKDKYSYILALRKVFREADDSFSIIRLFRIM